MHQQSGLTDAGVREKLRLLTGLAGGVRALARQWGFSHTYVYEVLSGKRPPSARILDKMGLKKEVLYVRNQ